MASSSRQPSVPPECAPKHTKIHDDDGSGDEEEDPEITDPDDPDYDPNDDDCEEEDDCEDDCDDDCDEGDEGDEGEDDCDDGDDCEEVEDDEGDEGEVEDDALKNRKMFLQQNRDMNNIIILPINMPASGGGRVCGRKRKCNTDDITQNFTDQESTYWNTQTSLEKEDILKKFKVLSEPMIGRGKVPLRFKILNSDISNSAKMLVLSKLDQFQTMPEGSGEYYKLRSWLSSLDKMPLGHYKQLPVSINDPVDKSSAFLQSVHQSLNDTVYGHVEAKQQIMRIMAQWITNPASAQGRCIGIVGSPGVGKTQLMKNGLSKALGLPFGFVALGGASDGSIMEGHSYTYEGSSYGKIAEVLMKTQCMNPILFFDELDKVSQSARGDEIVGILTHLTDSTQNDHFTDRYFGEIDINLSKALMIFSYNDESLINPVLKDRMITIRVSGYSLKDKIVIARDYMLPAILHQYNFKVGDVVFTDEILEHIVHKLAKESGVRCLKRGIESIVSWINMYRFIPPKTSTTTCMQFPLTITKEHVTDLLGLSDIEARNDMLLTMYT